MQRSVRIAEARGVIRGSSLLLLPIALSVCSACGQRGSRPRADIEAFDGGVSAEDGSTTPQSTGERPRLERSGQIVPLLYGRTVVVEHEAGEQTGPQTIPLDDPFHPAARTFFSALDGACEAELSELTRPPRPTTLSDCGAAAAYRMHEALCRAKAARLFAAEDARAGLVETEDGHHLDATGSMERAQAWRVRSQSAHARASWGLLAAYELRRVVAIAASAFDARVCSGSLARKTAGGVSLAELAAEALSQAYGLLPEVTREADALLQQRLAERARELEPLNPAERTLLTRDLTDSLLERMKLHAAIPYGAFAPVEGEDLASRAAAYDRYPVGPGVPSERTAQSVIMLAALGTEVVNASGHEPAGSTLLEAWFASLRDAHPMPFGALADVDAERALTHFGLSLADLEDGASWLALAARTAGSPVARTGLSRGPWHALRGLRYLDAPGPAAYPYALTEAAATLGPEPAEYALRGDEHALELAVRAARMAAEREDAAGAAAALTDLAAAADVRSSARVCLDRKGDGLAAEIEIRAAGGSGVGGARYALYRGEDDAVCATHGEAGGSPCAAQLSLPASFDEAVGAVRFHIDDAAPGSARFYLVDRDDEPAIVAAISLSPRDPVDERRCFDVPLSARLHRSLHAIHRDELAPLARVPALPQARAALTLGPGLTVPTLWGQRASVDIAGETNPLELGQPFDADYLRVERALLERCPAHIQQRGELRSGSCGLATHASVDSASCLAQLLSRAASAGLALGDLEIFAADDDERVALELWAFEARKRELVALAHAIDSFDCAASEREETLAAARAAEQELWSRAETALSDLEGHYERLRETVPALWQDRYADREPSARAALEVRALQGSKLAAARLLLAIPYELYEPEGADQELVDPLGHALVRFPVVTHPARYAEDARAEELLRRAALHPLLPASTVSSSGLDASELARAYGGDALALALRGRLLSEDPGTYQSAPRDAAGFLTFLGISRAELASAAARVVQLGEARGTGALIAHGSERPVRGLALRATSPAPLAPHLYGLTEGRASFSLDAWPTSFGMRGYFHAVSAAARALRARGARARDWTQDERAQRLASIDRFVRLASAASVDVELSRTDEGSVEIALGLSLPEPISERDALARFELWWTDAGLDCALSGHVGGAECREEDFRLDARAATLETGGAPDEPRVQLRGLHLPTPSTWDPVLSLAHERARIYLTERSAATRRAVAGFALSDQLSGRRSVQVPVSAGFDRGLIELLAYRSPGEGCRGCVPRSICESARCELGVCLRESAPEPLSCGHAGTCRQGACSAPGCGDGARSNGSDGVAYEACDDGNLRDGDGCSASCTVEQRALEPLIEEAYPAGPAPAVGVDGLGRSLIVYTADALSGDTISIRSALFDAFGVQRGSTATLIGDVARGYRSEPSVAGLRDGGFVVVSADARLPQGGIALRLIDADGVPAAPQAVDASGAIQTEPRVAAQDDGFIVAWTERDARSPASRVRLRRFDAHGVPFGPSTSVAAPGAPTTEQHQPALVSSLDQALVVWTERSAVDGGNLGIRAQRFSPLGYAVEAAAATVAEQGEQPSATSLQTDDYLVAWTERGGAGGADVIARVLRRFGPALRDSTQQPLAFTDAREERPLVVGAADGAALVIYQRGGPRASPVLHGPSIDPSTLEDAQIALDRSTEGDLSAVRAPRGIWVVWSERANQSRALYALLLPFDAAPSSLD